IFSKMKPTIALSLHEKQESLEVLNYQIRSCERCRLSATRKHALPGEGNIGARIMIVALSPGVKENEANRMFVGPSGQVLEKLLHAAGISREMIFMTNLVKCMLPGNCRPDSNEIELCGQFLDDEISIIQAGVLVPLGHYAARAVVDRYQDNSMLVGSTGKRIIFGKLLNMNDQKIYPLSHPASLLYNPSYEADMVERYKKLNTFL
ncbi:MAG: uracil-DNA glycosylase, partial [Bacteroidota bacterium]|nr:uracil-DNA glycosylase [Bacteroidota bacterium]